MISVIYSDEFLQHDNGRFHPERPDRLKAIAQALKAASWGNQIQWYLPTSIEKSSPIALLEQVHTKTYIQMVRQIAESGGGILDADTPISPQSYDVALLAVNAWIDGVKEVLDTGKPAFVLARPPGHHAEHNRGMGFCLFSNAAIAAYYALTQPNIRRVAILDWDVHHGNGTQDITQHHPQLAYCSLHQSPCYPGTGYAHERGDFDNVLNIPMAPGSTVVEYKQAFEQQVIPFLSQFQPDLLIVSAGYDANAADPLAGIALQPEDFTQFTDSCLQLTSRILFGLEGGYDLTSLAQSVISTIEPCLGIEKSGHGEAEYKD